jgi:hypothetical protein
VNPYNLEIAARERHKDLLRAAEQHRLLEALPANSTTRRLPIPASLGAIFMAFGQGLKMLANARVFEINRKDA